MPLWEFQRIQKNENGEISYLPLTWEQQRKVHDYTKALDAALDSNLANPCFSGYHVKESAINEDGEVVIGGNLEYGRGQAAHGEEVLGSRFGHQGTPPLVLGIIAGSPGNVASPCGNCRDYLRHAFGENFEIVSGAAEGGLAIVSNFNDYLFQPNQARLVPFSDIPGIIQNLVQMLIRRHNCSGLDPYTPENVHPERRYQAALVTKDYITYVGLCQVLCDYHPIYPIEGAVYQAMLSDDKSALKTVFILRTDAVNEPPDVLYRDRQALLEFNLIVESVSGYKQDPVVALVCHDKDGNITSVRETTVKQLLPHPFSPENFGSKFMQYFTKYHKEDRRSL